MPAPRRKKSKTLQDKQPLQSSAYQALARKIRERADELGLSIRVLADLVGRPRTTVHKTLTGQRRLDPIEFLDFCEALEWDDPVAVIDSVRTR
ncbi:MAG: helix-turn-helix domain-containing protein [Phycisphaeraceae bacterium]|nr:helix-turn-helix domain-containing protein [Phycisphaerales bacterium]MCB9843695.1 helix-turn-helix domain-containing protein [Phycisphaeraceae bacterium]